MYYCVEFLCKNETMHIEQSFNAVPRAGDIVVIDYERYEVLEVIFDVTGGVITIHIVGE